MKRIYLTTVMALFILFTALAQTKPKTVDLNASKAEVNALMEKYLKSWQAKDIKAIASFLADDGQFFGSDPTELWGKKPLIDEWTKFFADKSFVAPFKIEKRDIRVTPDGNSAIVVEQHAATIYTPKILWRTVSHVVKTGNNWKIDLISWSLVPKNDDLAKLNKALE